MNILDPRFKYTSSISTNVSRTWRKFGFTPTTEAERIARQRKCNEEFEVDANHRGATPVADFSLRACERASGSH